MTVSWLQTQIIDSVNRYGLCEVSRHLLEEAVQPDEPMSVAEARLNLMMMCSGEDPLRQPPMKYEEKIDAFAKKIGMTWEKNHEQQTAIFRKVK